MELVISHANGNREQRYFRERQFVGTICSALKIQFSPSLSVIHAGRDCLGLVCSVANLRLESAFLEASVRLKSVAVPYYVHCTRSTQTFLGY
jgi:hypothetical protein